jgi:hypothetical protein
MSDYRLLYRCNERVRHVLFSKKCEEKERVQEEKEKQASSSFERKKSFVLEFE